MASVAVIALVAGCQGTFPGGGGDATRAAPIGESVQLIERDVEAPEVFSARDRALWDGRPSLGGVWVAAPDVRDPERVIIRNDENGKFVIGALFKRERTGPGPALQLSSDAAAALGILAGSPTGVDVVALRREEMAAPTPAPAASAPQAVAEAETAPLAEEIVQTAALGPVATGAIETAPPAKTTESGNFLTRLFRRGGETTVLPDPSDLAAPVDQAVASGATAPAVTALDAGPVRTASASLPPSRSTGLDRAYVQIGIFSVEENARNTATSLSTAGILPTVLEQQSRGRTFWRVIVGPATRASDRAAVIRKAKSMGFTDAFATNG